MEENYVRRPLKRVSRKRYGEALRCLKEACASPKLSMTKRLRAAELLCLIYGLETGVANGRDRRSVKRLLVEDSFERTLRTRVREGVLSQTMREAKEEAERWLESWKSERTKGD